MAAAMSYVHADVENLKATELRLGLPGVEESDKMPSPPSTPRAGTKRALAGEHREVEPKAAPPAAKAQVVGWPPVRSYRKSCFQQASSKTKEGAARRRSRGRITVREGEHGRSPLPEEDRPQDVQGLPRAQGGPGGHVPRLLRRRRQREPVGLRRDLRGQGRRPHARRRRALRDVHEHLQEDEDHEGIRSKRPRIIKGV
uniref:Auxin-responsive protein n=1 Tax=Aegilops tauschii subsp. strangulata TaxID=200361 RepID=A0A453JRK9_AEGTS